MTDDPVGKKILEREDLTQMERDHYEDRNVLNEPPVGPGGRVRTIELRRWALARLREET